MNSLSFRTIFIILTFRRPVDALSDFATCQDDFELKPQDGLLKKNTFGWLGFLQFMHVTTGLPHQTKAPRVVLIHRQFVLGTAVDLLVFPTSYQLQNVIFAEYEREEADCGLTKQDLQKAKTCPPAYLEMPIVSILPHPEYTGFGVANSVALAKLLRPIKSRYMIPICMPSIGERMRKRINKNVFMIDYVSTAPQDLDTERMGKRTLKLYTHKECRVHRQRTNLLDERVSHMLCSTGCGIRSGAPIISQNAEGGFEIIGIATESALCTSRSRRRRLNKEPPLYIDVYPYSVWIVNFITAHEIPKSFPVNFRTLDNGMSMGVRKGVLRTRGTLEKEGWRKRTYVSGNFCFTNNREHKKNAAFFYSEKFEVKHSQPTRLHIDMKISAGIECTIVCARLLLPNRLITPEIVGIGGYNISVKFTTEWFPKTFYYSLGLMGKNSTESDLKSWLQERDTDFWP